MVKKTSMKSSERVMSHVQVFLSCLIVLLNPVNSFTLLESGQRIEPITRTDRPINPNTSKITERIHTSKEILTTKQLSEKSKIKTTGFLDLPAIEKWAQSHDVKEHHIKTLYRVLLRHFDESSFTPINFNLDSNKIENNDQPLLSLALYDQLLKCDFPQKLATSLFQPSIIDPNEAVTNTFESPNGNKQSSNIFNNFVPCTSKVIKVQPSESGGFKMVIQLQSGQMVETVIIRHDRSTANNKTGKEGDITHKKNASLSNNDKFVEKRHHFDQKSHNMQKSLHSTRYTVCVSSQVGCARACTFCATGSMGLKGQLSSCEILEQVFHAKCFISSLKNQSNNNSDVKDVNLKTAEEGQSQQKRKQKQKQNQFQNEIRNVVFMGMGEPLDNYDPVLEACRGLTHQCLFGLKARQVTISTVGATPERIRWLAEDAPSISLALSLHGATRELREELIPSARHLKRPFNEVESIDMKGDSDGKKINVDSIDELGDALDYHSKCTGKGAMIEYLLIDGVNDSDDAADALGQFCLNRKKNMESFQNSSNRGKGVINFVNLIPYNPTLAGDNFGYGTPSNERVDLFCQRLRKRYGVRALVRWSSAGGRDTDGACGQLALTTMNR